VQAILGKEGIFRGTDYRGVDVLADLHHIPESPWFMVAKVDASEILAEARYRGGIVALFAALFIVLAASLTAYRYRYGQVLLYWDLFRSERETRMAQEEFRTTLYSIGDGVITTDTNGLVKQMNSVAERLTGWSETVARGKILDEVFHIVNEESRAVLENPVKRVLREGTVVGSANHSLLISKDGTEYPIAESGAPIVDEKGTIAGVVLIFRDQTEERAAQNALREQYEQLKESERKAAFFADLLERSSLPLGVGYFDGHLGTVNEAFCRLTGYSREELATLDWAKVLTPPEWREFEFAKLEELQRTGQPVRYEKEYVRKDGNRVPVELLVHLVKDESGAPKYYYAFVADITDRKKAEEALKESEEWYRAIVEESFDGVFVQKGPKIVYANSVLYEMLGYSEGELEGIDHWLIYHPHHQKAVRERAMARMRGETLPHEFEVKLQRKNGSHFDGEINARFVTVKGEPGVRVWVRDISKKKRLEEVQRRLATAIEQAGEAIVLIDDQGRIEYVNPAHERITGYTREEVIGSFPPLFNPS
jgi:PAS domain S-box-containing protein